MEENITSLTLLRPGPSQSMEDPQHNDKNRFEWFANCNAEICAGNIIAPSFADDHLQHFYEVKVEEMDVKQEISADLDGDVADLKDMRESTSKNEILTSSIKHMNVNSDDGVLKVPIRICHQYQSVVECPACDKSYKSGSNRLPCLLKHIAKFHPSDANKLCSKIIVDFKKRNSCNCSWLKTAWESCIVG